MFAAISSVFAVIASFFKQAERATGTLDAIVSETLISSKLSLVEKANNYQTKRAEFAITDDEVANLLASLETKRK